MIDLSSLLVKGFKQHVVKRRLTLEKISVKSYSFLVPFLWYAIYSLFFYISWNYCMFWYFLLLSQKIKMLLLLFLCIYAHICIPLFILWRSELRLNSGVSTKCLFYFPVTKEKSPTKVSHVNIPGVFTIISHGN